MDAVTQNLDLYVEGFLTSLSIILYSLVGPLALGLTSQGLRHISVPGGGWGHLDRHAQGPGGRGQARPVVPLGQRAVIRGHPVHEADRPEPADQRQPFGPKDLACVIVRLSA